MVSVNLQPLAKDPRSLPTYLDLNLRRLADAIATLGRVEQARLEVTGSVTVDTGIPVVKNVVASLAEQPSNASAYVTARLDPSNTRNVIVEVWQGAAGAYAASVTATDVNIIVVGDEPPRS